MVFFTCNACGESLKKAHVEKHYQTQCRRCEVLSCVDCGKDFWGDAYKEHTKCISEEEKYSGKDFKPKPGANKGEKKQEAWIEQVQQAIDKASANPKLRSLLLQIKDYSNIPRKKAKFENFLKNSARVRDTGLITKAWDCINAEIIQQQDAKTELPPANGVKNNKEETTSESNTTSEVTEINGTEKKLSKRERKEERRKQANKKEKKDRTEDTEEGSGKKGKKRKLEETENQKEENITKKKKKKKDSKEEAEEVEENVDEQEENGDTEESEELVEARPKFKWDSAILEVIRAAKGHEISLKKLRKKVFAEYQATGGDGKSNSEDQLIAKFNKKIRKAGKWKIIKDNVKLMDQ